MKRGTFKKPTLEEVKRKQAEKREKDKLKVKTKKIKKVEVPAFLKPVKEGSHGTGSLQKRCWKIVSDYVRIRDWYKYKGISVTGQYIPSWKDGDAGHFISWDSCQNIYKYNVRNIHLQQSNSNRLGSMADGEKFAETLNKRYGKGYTDLLHKENNALQNRKLDNNEVLEYTISILKDFKNLQEQPDYYERVMIKLKEYEE